MPIGSAWGPDAGLEVKRPQRWSAAGPVDPEDEGVEWGDGAQEGSKWVQLVEGLRCEAEYAEITSSGVTTHFITVLNGLIIETILFMQRCLKQSYKVLENILTGLKHIRTEANTQQCR